MRLPAMNLFGNARQRILFTAIALSALAVGCVPERERRGDINLVYGTTGQRRAVFGVEAGRIVSQQLDIATQGNGADACVRGTWGTSAISLCPKALDDSDAHFGGKLTRWSGLNGDLAIEVSPNGAAVRVDGRLSHGSGAGLAAADASVHASREYPGDGGRHGGFGLSSDRGGGSNPGQQTWMHITLPLGHGPEWDEMRKTPILYAVAAASVGLISGEAVQPDQVPSKERKDQQELPATTPTASSN